MQLDSVLLILGGSIAAAILNFPSDGRGYFLLAVLLLFGFIRLHHHHRTKAEVLVPHEAVGMSFAGFLITISLLTLIVPNPPPDRIDDIALSFLLLAAGAVSIAIAILAAINRLQGGSSRPFVYDAIRRAASSSPYIFLSSYMSLQFFSTDKSLPPDWIAVSYWSVVIGWSLFHPPKAAYQLLFVVFHLVLFFSFTTIDVTPFILSVLGFDFLVTLILAYVLLSGVRLGIANIRRRGQRQ